MQELYSDRDWVSINTMLKKRLWLLLAAEAVLLALLVWSFIVRIQWLSIVLLLLVGGVAIFCYDLFFSPLLSYRRLLRNALTGRMHTDTFEYSSEEPDPSLVEGVPCRGLIFLGEPDKHGTREQRFYWDCEKPLPAFRPGDSVQLKYTGKNIIAYQI